MDDARLVGSIDEVAVHFDLDVETEGLHEDDRYTRLKLAIKRGRISIDDESDELIFKLRKPIRQKRGSDAAESSDELRFRQPIVADRFALADAAKKHGMGMTVYKIVARLTGALFSDMAQLSSFEGAVLEDVINLFF